MKVFVVFTTLMLVTFATSGSAWPCSIFTAHDNQTTLVGNNFLPANPSAGGYPCGRYTKLESMMKSGLQLTPAYFVSMAEAVRQGNLTLLQHHHRSQGGQDSALLRGGLHKAVGARPQD